MKKMAFLVLFLTICCAAIAHADVVATGEGPGKEQALAAAMRRAVEQKTGAYVNSQSVVQNFELVEDKILSHSKGYVTGYKIVKEEKTDDGYSVTIDAKVDSKLLKEDVEALTILRKNVGNPRFLVLAGKGDGKTVKGKEFLDELYEGIVESLTDKEFRVVDKGASDSFALQTADVAGTDPDLNKAAAYGLKYNAEYTLYYNVSGDVKQGAINTSLKLRIKARLVDNTRSQVITSKVVETTSTAQSLEQALDKAAREGGRKVVAPMIEVVQKNWMEMQQNGFLYTVILDGVDDPEEIARFTGMLEKFPLVTSAREVESGGGKSTFEATYRGKRDQLDRDVVRSAKELGWTVKKVRAEGARTLWKKAVITEEGP